MIEVQDAGVKCICNPPKEIEDPPGGPKRGTIKYHLNFAFVLPPAYASEVVFRHGFSGGGPFVHYEK